MKCHGLGKTCYGYIILTVFIFFSFHLTAQPGFIHINDTTYDLTYQRLEISADPTVRYIAGKSTIYFTERHHPVSFNIALLHLLTADSVFYHSQKISFLRDSDILSVDHAFNSIDSLTIFYHGNLLHQKDEYFYDTTHESAPVIWTLAEPFGACGWMPAKMGLNDKIDSMDMLVTIPSQYKSSGNGVLVNEKISGNQKIVHWRTRYPIESYLVAFSVTNYLAYSDVVPLRGKNLPMLNYVYPEKEDDARKGTAALIPVFQWMDSLLIPYPFMKEKYGHAQITANGAMEHQSMTYTGLFSLELLVHELAHQWFGDYITCGSWNDIWLNEGFATYITGLSFERGFYPNTFRQWLDGQISAATKDTVGAVYIDKPEDEMRIFDHRLTYQKGAMILHMLRWELGDQAFFDGLRDYLLDPALAYHYASASDFKNHMEKISGKNLDEFFDQWYYKPGYPVYHVMWRQNDNNDAVLTLYQTPSAGNTFYKMKVPVKLMNDAKDTTVILDHHFSGEDFHVNIGFHVKKIIIDPNRWIVTPHKDTIIVDGVISGLDVHLYPNPASVVLNVEVPTNAVLLSFKVINMSGVLVGEYIPTGYHIYSFDVSFLPSGMYLARLNVSGKLVTKKFIVKSAIP